jgi:ADP-ribose pyrophosphatase YjhB (NUDIX family)
MTYSFCPKCGHFLTSRLVDGHQRLVCVHCDFVFYQNSKPTSSVLVVEQGRVLLVRQGIEPYLGWWDIPGGFLEAGEHPEAGAVREVAEETGLQIRPTELLGVYMDAYGQSEEYTLNLCYVAELVGGRPNPVSDVTELRWFELEALPEQVAFNWSMETLTKLQQKYGQSEYE